jgi:hypothetical protein
MYRTLKVRKKKETILKHIIGNPFIMSSLTGLNFLSIYFYYQNVAPALPAGRSNESLKSTVGTKVW